MLVRYAPEFSIAYSDPESSLLREKFRALREQIPEITDIPDIVKRL
jgi:hypothetical protein